MSPWKSTELSIVVLHALVPLLYQHRSVRNVHLWHLIACLVVFHCQQVTKRQKTYCTVGSAGLSVWLRWLPTPPVLQATLTRDCRERKLSHEFKTVCVQLRMSVTLPRLLGSFSIANRSQSATEQFNLLCSLSGSECSSAPAPKNNAERTCRKSQLPCKTSIFGI